MGDAGQGAHDRPWAGKSGAHPGQANALVAVGRGRLPGPPALEMWVAPALGKDGLKGAVQVLE